MVNLGASKTLFEYGFADFERNGNQTWSVFDNGSGYRRNMRQ